MATAETVAEVLGQRRKAGGAALGIGSVGFLWLRRPGPALGAEPPPSADADPLQARFSSSPHPLALAPSKLRP